MSSSVLSIVYLVICLVLLHTSLAQNYHFSNGWYAGKKRSAPSPHSQPSMFDSYTKMFEDDSCSLRPEALLLINRIIQDEVVRIQKVCTVNPPSGLQQFLEGTETN